LITRIAQKQFPALSAAQAFAHRLGYGSVVSSAHRMNDPQPEGHMVSYIRRRKFLATLGSAAVAWPFAARAQQPGKLPTIGFLVAGTPSSHGPWVAGFVQRLRELGWIDGRTVTIEYRWAEGRSDRAAEIAAEFVRRNVDVIVTSATAVIVAAMQATSVIPIVFAAGPQPKFMKTARRITPALPRVTVEREAAARS
jgi:ABC transporter substrate binding protein